jgi:hypothetical protein
MKTKRSIPGFLLVAAFAVLLIPSCSKDDAGNMSDADLALAQDEAYADALYEEVDNMVITEISALDGNQYIDGGTKSTSDDICRTITVDHPDTTWFPKIVTVDYGDGCTMVFNDDTITRKGKIIITLTDRWFKPGAEHIVTFSDFYINGIKIEGIRTITNMGLNEDLHLQMGIKLEQGKIIFNDTAWMTREADHVREWILHLNPQNDTVLITGTASGINIKGETYERLITEPLVMVHCTDYHWRWVIVDGTIQITTGESAITTLDYSSSGCDGTVVVNKNGVHHNYRFKFRHHNHWGGR